MQLPLAAEYPFLNILGSMLFFFCFVIWLMLLFTIFGDLFRRQDIGGWGKTGWFVFIIVLPFLGAFVYLVSQSKAMAERKAEDMSAAQAQFDQHIREKAGSDGGADPAAQIAKAKGLLDSGAINQQEFDALKSKALAPS